MFAREICHTVGSLRSCIAATLAIVLSPNVNVFINRSPLEKQYLRVHSGGRRAGKEEADADSHTEGAKRNSTKKGSVGLQDVVKRYLDKTVGVEHSVEARKAAV